MSGYSVPSSLVDTAAALTNAIDKIAQLPSHPPALFVDLEGDLLSRKGTLTIITVYVKPKAHVYIFDVLTLKGATFITPGSRGNTLKHILESSTIPKVFFDVRNDSDALFSHYGIALKGVQDVQLMELASRPGHVRGKRSLSSLTKCIERDRGLRSGVKASWNAAKKRMHAILDAKPVNGTHVFAKRPLSQEAVQYCIGDVCFLPRLYTTYWARLNNEWRSKVQKETLARVALSQKPSYDSYGRDKALGPWRAPAQDAFAEDQSAFLDHAFDDAYDEDPFAGLEDALDAAYDEDPFAGLEDALDEDTYADDPFAWLEDALEEDAYAEDPFAWLEELDYDDTLGLSPTVLTKLQVSIAPSLAPRY